MDDRVHAIVVGAGLAGLAAAYTLARAGLDVIILERGEYPGSKNVTGGRLYVNPIRDLFPDLWNKAPLERFINREGITIMAKERSLSTEYQGGELSQAPYQSYSVLRAKFDRFLAKEAENQGAMLVTGCRVDSLIIEDGQVKGVSAAGDELRANVVIACDGVLSLMAEQAGLSTAGPAKNFGLGIKEVIEMDREVIENRFGLLENEGAARLFMGEVTAGKFGGGFLYTNLSSISLGLVVGIGDLVSGEPSITAPELMDNFKRRPEIQRLIRGGQTVEYAAHVIPEGGYKTLARLYGNGILVAGDAAGLAMNLGLTVRGMEYAMASGYYAAQTVIQTTPKDDFTSASLALYDELLRSSFVLQDFTRFQEAPHVLDNKRFFQHYPELAGNIMRDLYAVPNGPKKGIYSTVKGYMNMSEVWAMLGDLRKVMKI